MTDLASGAATRDADRAAGVRLAALLRSKPPTDQVSLAAWWFVVSSLETAVPVRRAIDGVEVLSAAALARAVARAQRPVRAALEELPADVVSLPFATQTSDAIVPRLRTTIRTLALLVVTPRVTTTPQLSDALINHWRALARCHPSAALGVQLAAPSLAK
jgi:hypothetical protein